MIKKVLVFSSGVVFSIVAWHFIAQGQTAPKVSEEHTGNEQVITEQDDLGIRKGINDGLPSDAIQTRYGIFQVTGGDTQSKLVGHVYRAASELVAADDSQIEVDRKFEFGDADVILVGETNGSSCPMLFRFFTIKRDSISSTEQFGTCSDLVSIARRGDSLTLTMPVVSDTNASSNSNQAAETGTYRFNMQRGNFSPVHE